MPAATEPSMMGYLRADGGKGIRNVTLVVYLVECAHHVARQIAQPYNESGAQVIGFSGCFPNLYALSMLQRLCTHPNVGGALLISLGCESMDRHALAETIATSGRPVHTLVIQESGGTAATIEAGRAWLAQTIEQLHAAPRAPLAWSDLVVGTLCGGSDATSGLTANPAIGGCFDLLVERGATAIFQETGELIGCEQMLASRARTPELGEALVRSVGKAARFYSAMGHGSFAPGNAEGGLTTLEEKSLGAYAKSGHGPISGLLNPGDSPAGKGGLYLQDAIPDDQPRFGYPNINDNSVIGDLIASGAHLILFATGRGSVVGSAISPVIKICANPQTYRKLRGDMDINAGRILEGEASLEQVSREILDRIQLTIGGEPTVSEALGHQEFVLTYKSPAPAGPSCLAAN